MELSNGKLFLKDGLWHIDEAPPHVAIKLKALFPNIAKWAVNPFTFPDTPDSCNDLVWFTDRYKMQIEMADAKALAKRKRKYDKLQDDMGRLLVPGYEPVPQQFNEGKAERPFQAIARELHGKMKKLIVGDEFGLGKTVIALGTFVANPKTLPAVVVVQTHLPEQWKKRQRNLQGLQFIK